jgi:Tfp pilus assembly protein PilF
VAVIAAAFAIVAGAVIIGSRMLQTPRATPAAITPSAVAREAYLKGRHHWSRRTGPDFRKATEYYRTAVESDPQFALAWAGLADAYNFLGDAPRARVAAARALEIDDRLAPAHAALANVKLFHDFDPAAAERQLRRAIAIDPSYATAHHWQAFALVAQGKFDEAQRAIERARSLEPASLIVNADVAAILYYARRYDDAIVQLHRTIELEPGFVQSHQLLALAYARKGMHKEAAAAMARTPVTADQRIDFRVLSGEAGAARRLRELDNEPDTRVRGVANAILARAFAAAGDAEGAARSLERAYAAREGDVVLVRVDPAFDAVRRAKPMQEFLARRGL